MSINESTVKGKWDEIAGKAKQAFGEATGNHSAANSGTAQEVKGHAEQSWGSVKEAAHDTATGTSPRAESDAHDVRESVSSTAANVKNHIQHATDPYKDR